MELAAQRHGSGAIEASIVIVTYGKWPVTERCLRSLEQALGERLGSTWEIIVVDNGSPDETPARLTEWADRIHVELLAQNRNFAGGCNRGAELARGEAIVFLNNDTEVSEGALELLVEQLHEPAVAAAGCRLLFPNGTVQHCGVAFIRGRALDGAAMPQHILHHQDGGLAATMATFETDAVTAACIAVRAEAFRAVGGFDEQFVNGLEDIDLCLKLRIAGHKIVYRGDITIIHHEGASRGQGQELFNTEAKFALMRHNDEHFNGRWGAQVGQDDELAEQVWGARLRDQPPARGEVPIAEVALVGQVSGIGPAADEVRALLIALTSIKLVPCIYQFPQPTVVAPLPEVLAALIDVSHRIAARPDVRGIYVPAGPSDEFHIPGRRLGFDSRATLRLGWSRTAVDLSQVRQVLCASQAVARQLLGDGLPASRVNVMPPLIPTREAGAGGAGLLVNLPVHEPALSAAILDSLRRLPASLPIRLLPSVYRRELPAMLAAELPRAELLPPCAIEDRYAELAQEADAVLCADPADVFERRALVAAGVGSRPLSLLPDGPVADVLGADFLTDTAGLPDALRAALELPRAGAALMQRVACACDPHQISKFL